VRFQLILCFTPFTFEIELFWARFVPQAVSVDHAPLALRHLPKHLFALLSFAFADTP
jgi:hypothetical protein